MSALQDLQQMGFTSFGTTYIREALKEPVYITGKKEDGEVKPILLAADVSKIAIEQCLTIYEILDDVCLMVNLREDKIVIETSPDYA